MFKIQTLIPLFLLPFITFSFAAKITMDTTTTTSITTYQTDLGECECNTSGNCDNFCCCDGDCSSSVTASWTTSGWCRNSAAEI